MSFRVTYEFLNVLTVKNTAFWDVTPRSLVAIYQSFGETYSLHFLLHSSTLKIETVSFCEMLANLNKLHGVIIQQTAF
jgi:hypothetical protein